MRKLAITVLGLAVAIACFISGWIVRDNETHRPSGSIPNNIIDQIESESTKHLLTLNKPVYIHWDNERNIFLATACDVSEIKLLRENYVFWYSPISGEPLPSQNTIK